jgi:hypothetical protein
MAITIQSNYATDYTRGFPGMLADGNTQSRPSGTIEDAAGVAFGKAVFQGVADRGLTATVGTKFKGITIADAGIVPPIGGAADTYAQYASASLLDQGNIFVTAGSATTAGAAAFVTAGGAFTTVSAGNTAIPATFAEAVASGATVKLRVVQA